MLNITRKRTDLDWIQNKRVQMSKIVSSHFREILNYFDGYFSGSLSSLPNTIALCHKEQY